MISSDGALATCYRKVLLFEADETWANPGWRRPVCPTPMGRLAPGICMDIRSEEHTSELQSRLHLVCRLLLEKKKNKTKKQNKNNNNNTSHPKQHQTNHDSHQAHPAIN